MQRRIRRTASFLAILALLFSQLAVSAFACPVVTAALAPEATVEHRDCGVPVTPNLCQSHCDYGDSNVNHAVPDSAPGVLALPLPWRASPQPVSMPEANVMVETPQRSHSPPPLDLFGFLRI